MTEPSITTILFDFAGVLVSSPWPAMTEAGGGNLELLIGAYEEDGDHPWHQVERGEIGIGDWVTEVTRRGNEVGVEIDFSPLQALLGELTVHTQVVDRVRSLRASGYQLGLITNNVREASGSWRALVPVDELFDVVVDSSEVGMRKPNPAIYLHALDLLGGVVPAAAVFLDDSPGNVVGARQAGLHAIHVETPDQALAELDALLGVVTTGVLLVSCPDRPGIVAAVASFVASHGGNVIDLQQHTDHTDAAFFQRVEFELDRFDLERSAIADAFAPVAEQYAMQWSLRFSDERLRVGVLASREPHCLQDILNRWRTGELPVDVVAVISNHPDHAELAEWFGVPHHHLPIEEDDRQAQEDAVRRVLQGHGVDLVVLARYMQVLSADFCATWPERIINIHHSFLPAFQGARPYHQAHERGVKLVGVTAHYATAALDDGPIIDQDVIRVSHRDDVDDLRRKGRDLEVTVLARAVRAHVSHRVLVYGRRTVVFD